MYADLLALDDPLLERVKASALHSDVALTWLCDSVRHWARGEFVRRMEEKDAHPEIRWASDHLDAFEVQREYHRKQVAALVTHRAGTDAHGKPINREEIIVGLCQPEMTDGFVAIKTGRTEFVRGVFDVLDIVCWPKEYKLHHWPTEADVRKPPNGSPTVHCTKCHDEGVVPIFNNLGEVVQHVPCPDCKTGGSTAIVEAIHAMREMTEVRVSCHVKRKLTEHATSFDTFSVAAQQASMGMTVFGTPVIVDGRLRANDIMGLPDSMYLKQPGQLEHECPHCGVHTICWTLTGERPAARCINCGHGP